MLVWSLAGFLPPSRVCEVPMSEWMGWVLVQPCTLPSVLARGASLTVITTVL